MRNRGGLRHPFAKTIGRYKVTSRPSSSLVAFTHACAGVALLAGCRLGHTAGLGSGPFVPGADGRAANAAVANVTEANTATMFSSKVSLVRTAR